MEGVLEEDGSGNSEYEGSAQRRGKTSYGFVAWFIVFGWEGPLGIYLGLRDGDIGIIIGGILITALFWNLLGGIYLLKDFLKSK